MNPQFDAEAAAIAACQNLFDHHPSFFFDGILRSDAVAWLEMCEFAFMQHQTPDYLKVVTALRGLRAPALGFFWPTPYPGNLQGWLWFREDILHLFHPPRAARMAAQRAFRWDLLPGESVHDWVDRFEDIFVMPPLPFPMDHGFLCFVFARALPPWVTFMVEYPDPPNILLFMDTVRVMVPDIQPVLALPAPPAAPEPEPEPVPEVVDPETP